MKNNILGAIILVAIIGGVAYFVWQSPKDTFTALSPTASSTAVVASSTPVDKTKTVIGTSIENRDIVAYHFGNGSKELLFVGGIHGGYEWNTSVLAYEFMDYLKANPNIIPANLKITVIPVLNPDGLNKVTSVTGPFTAKDVSASSDLLVEGRFNASGVDLNRNFDCDWQPKGVWQKTTVSGGVSAFSEKESQAMRNYIETSKPSAVIVWYSAAGGVFASSCHNGVTTETKTLTSTFASASGYKAYDSFDFYETTGDMVNWLAKINIPAVSVILTNHTDTEWDKNRAGIEAVLEFYANK